MGLNVGDTVISSNQKEAEGKFVDKDVCKVLHKTLDKNIEEIKQTKRENA